VSKLILIDSHALIHRSYHAIKTPLTSPTGEPTGATYGFANSLLKVFREEKPDYVIAAFDVGTPARVQKLEQYKANRPELASDLRVQLKRSREVCEALGIPTFGIEGLEADDLIATLAAQANKKKTEVIIFTGDTDTLQLVNEHTRVLLFEPRVGGQTVLYDTDKVKERYALEPKQLIDFKALRGDSSDNVPGVPGVGDKTATKLLQDYDTVEGIYKGLKKVEGKLRDKLAEAQAQVELSKELVTLQKDAPIKLDFDAARFGEFDRERAVTLFRELGFRSLLARVDELLGREPSETDGSSQPNADKYATVDSEEKLEALATKLRRGAPFAVDVETTSLDAMTALLVGIAIGVGDGEAYYIPLEHVEGGNKIDDSAKKTPKGKTAKEAQASLFESAPVEPVTPTRAVNQLDRAHVIKVLGPIFADAAIPKYAHNGKYDTLVLAQHDLPLNNLAFDSLLAAHLVELPGQGVGLKDLAWRKFNVQMTEIEGLIGKGKNQITIDQAPVEKVSRYACADGDFTFRLAELYHPQIDERNLHKLFYEIEMPLVPVLVDMERAGVLLDRKALGELSVVLAERMSALEKEIYKAVGAPFNLASPAQLSDALFNKLKLSSQGLGRTSTGQISTAAGVLESLSDQNPVIPLILEHRVLAKLKGTYVDALPVLVNPKTGRVHTTYNQIGAVTGRLSSNDPNLQNIPVRTEEGRLVRRAFIAAPGHALVSADYSQVELRIAAHISQDPNLLEAFAKDEDIHAATASLLFNVPLEQVTPEMRARGKTINFGVIYGISDWGVTARTDLSRDDSRQLIANYFSKYAKVKEYLDETKRLAREQGYVETIFGRRRYFPELKGGGGINPALRNRAEREAINHPIQGSAADIIKLAMVNLHRELQRFQTRMLLQVHDELVFEAPENEVDKIAPVVRDVMENSYKMDVRLKTDIKVGPNWDRMKAWGK
jgi:DNA polymerase-1